MAAAYDFGAGRWHVHFTEALAAGAISNFIPCCEGAKLDIFDVIPKGILLRLLDVFVSRPESPQEGRPNAM